jgi:hypothetical protein
MKKHGRRALIYRIQQLTGATPVRRVTIENIANYTNYATPVRGHKACRAAASESYLSWQSNA